MRRNRYVLGTIDWLSLLLYLALVIIGWLSIYAAMYDEHYQSIFDLSQRYGKQLLWIGLALIIGFIVLLTDDKFFLVFSWPIYVFMLLVLIGVLLFGTTIAGSKSWFQIGSFALQPAEFAKFSTALALSAYLSGLNVDFRQAKTRLVSFIIILLPAFLTLLQYDTGSALVFVSFLIVFYRQGLPGWPFALGIASVALFLIAIVSSPLYVMIGLSIVFALSLAFIKRNRSNILYLVLLLVGLIAFVYSADYIFDTVLEPHQRTRINVLLELKNNLRRTDYNIHQSKIAIGSGGLFGKGFLNGTQTKFNFVPEQSTDFIFCTVGEEWGFVGVSVLIGLFILLLVRLVNLAERQRSEFARIYGYGIVSVLFFHFAVNIGMTIGVVPVIGIPLPFVSYCGSSLWAFTLMLFVFLKLDANRLNIL